MKRFLILSVLILALAVTGGALLIWQSALDQTLYKIVPENREELLAEVARLAAEAVRAGELEPDPTRVVERLRELRRRTMAEATVNHLGPERTETVGRVEFLFFDREGTLLLNTAEGQVDDFVRPDCMRLADGSIDPRLRQALEGSAGVVTGKNGRVVWSDGDLTSKTRWQGGPASPTLYVHARVNGSSRPLGVVYAFLPMAAASEATRAGFHPLLTPALLGVVLMSAMGALCALLWWGQTARRMRDLRRFAHEMKQPLANLSALMGRARAELPAKLTAQVDVQVYRLAGMVDALLEKARLDATDGPDAYRPVMVAVEDLWHETVERFSAVLDQRKVNLQEDLDAEGAFTGYRGLIQSAMAALLENALEHGDPSTGIAVGLKMDQGELSLTVENDAGKPAPQLAGGGKEIVEACAKCHRGGFELHTTDHKVRAVLRLRSQR